MRHLSVFRWPTLLVAVLLIAAACGDDDDAAAYLEEIEEAARPLSVSSQEVDETLGQTWPVRGRLIEVLLEADRPSLFETMLSEVQGITPHPDFVEDRARLIAEIESSIARSTAEDQALEDGDLVQAVILVSESNRALRDLLQGVSSEFCDAVVPDDNQCSGNDAERAHGEYGEALFAAWRRYGREFGSRASAFSPAMSPEERFESLRILQPEIVRAHDLAIEEVGALTPPQVLVADHDRLLQYFEEQRQTALDIDAAVIAGDTELVLQLFAFSGVVACTAAEDLTDEIQPLIDFAFSEPCSEPE